MNAWRRLTPAKQRLVVAAIALVAYVLVLFIWGSTGSSGTHPRPLYADDSSTDGATGLTPLVVIGGGLLVLAAVMLLYTFATLLRARGPRFKDLEASEQERRREAGRLLKGDPGQP